MCVFHTCIMVHMIVCVQIMRQSVEQVNGSKTIRWYTMISSPSSTMATTLSQPVIPCNHARSTFRSRLALETSSCPVFSCRKITHVLECVLLDIYQVIDIAQPPMPAVQYLGAERRMCTVGHIPSLHSMVESCLLAMYMLMPLYERMLL